MSNPQHIRPREDVGPQHVGSAAADSAQAPAPGRVDLSTIIIVGVILLGAAIIAYPTFSDWWNSYHQTRAIASYVASVEEMDDSQIDQVLADAHRYNEELLSKSNRFVMSDEEKAAYEATLNITGTGVMGYIQISRLGINYPIYHGVDEKYLQVAIGHIEGTSLPVGGPTTHAAVSGHRGLPSAKLFSDLDRLVEGDTFTISVLKEVFTYEVDQIRIVEPEDLSDLKIEPDKDYVTLITCTPYGVNTHRLLVRGHRIDNAVDTVVVPAEAVQIPSYVAVPAVAVPMLFVYLVGSFVYYHFKRDSFDKDLVMRELDSMKDQTGSDADTKEQG